MDKTVRFRVVTILSSADNGYVTHSLVAILRGIAYETFTILASLRLSRGYARAGANPNALA